MDDFPNDASTNGLYTVNGQPFQGINEDFADADWIRVNGLSRWHLYNVWFYSTEVRPRFTRLELLESSGEIVPRLTDRFPDLNEYRHEYSGSGPLFLNAAQTSRSGPTVLTSSFSQNPSTPLARAKMTLKR